MNRHSVGPATRGRVPGPPITSGALQRECTCGTRTIGDTCAASENREPTLQRCKSNENTGRILTTPIVHDLLRSKGQPLERGARARMESRFGHDFSDVRVHTDPRAAESARLADASAYTVGRDIVFGAGRYDPSTSIGGRLLAHELAHTIQQRGRRSELRPFTVADPQRLSLEREADHAANAVSRGEPADVSSTSMVPSPQFDGPGGDGAAQQAARAELFCDLATLCRLRFAEPTLVSPERVRQVAQRCRPSMARAALDPCLVPGSLAPPVTQAPHLPGGQPPPAGAAAPSLRLPSTTLRLNLGPARLTIDLPTSVSLSLPTGFQAARSIEFSMSGAGEQFSFVGRINDYPHVRITARVGLNRKTEMVSAGLTVETTRTVCQALDEAGARTRLQSAGERLRDAILTAQNPPAPAAGESDLERTFAPARRLGDVAAGIGAVHQAVESVRARCREVPFATFEVGGRAPFGESRPPSAPPTKEDLERATVIGGSVTVHF